MPDRSIFRRAATLIGLVSLPGCIPATFNPAPFNTVQWRMTVEVEDGGVIRTGEAVWSLRTRPVSGLHSRTEVYFDADAVPVVLGDGRAVYVLPFVQPEGGMGGGIIHALGQAYAGQDAPSGLDFLVDQISRRPELSIELPCAPSGWLAQRPRQTLCPMIVTFADEKDSTTVRALAPQDFAATFGPNVHLRSIRATVVNEPVTREDIGRRLPWLSQFCSTPFQPFQRPAVLADLSLAQRLLAVHFSLGDDGLCRRSLV